jgi:hypothetical protein
MRLALLALVACGSSPAPVVVEPARGVPIAIPVATPTTPTTTAIVGECIGPTCFTSPAGFRSVHPLPVTDTLRQVVVTPSGEVWIVGDRATLLHIKRDAGGTPTIGKISIAGVPTVASVFESLEKGSTKDFPGSELRALDFDGLAVKDPSIWVAAGSDHLIHWDGRAWTHIPSRSAGEEMMIAKDGRLWVVGAINVFSDAQTPQIFDPKKPGMTKGPTIPQKGHLSAIARQGDDVWVSGMDGMLFRSRRNATFERVPLAEAWFRAMWLDEDGTAGYVITGSKVFARSGNGFVPWHDADRIQAVFASPGGFPAWFVGDYLWRATSAKDAPARVNIDGDAVPGRPILSLDADRFESVHGRSPDDVWLVGRAGMIAHWDGHAIRELFPRFAEDTIVGIAWLDAKTWLVATRDGVLLTGTLAGVTKHEPAPGFDKEDPQMLATLRSGEVVLGGCRSLVVRERDGTWSPLPKLPGCPRAIAGTDRAHLWAVGSRELVDGKAWRLERGVWIGVPTGMGEHDDLRAIAVAADGTVWMAGNHAILRGDAKGLRRVHRHEYDEYRGIAIRGANDVWFATNANDIGAAGSLLHWNGKAFERHDRLTTNFLSTVIALPDGSVHAFGLGGVGVSSTDGKTFTPIEVGTTRSISHASADANGNLVLGGDFGTVLVRSR